METSASERPNIVIILADDMGFGDVGCYNPASRIPTPHIDALAARGARWTDMHTPSAVCTPSRYGLLTGSYCWRGALPYSVLYGYEPPLIDEGTRTLAGGLAAAGYNTSCVGKWHLGLEFRAKQGATVDFAAPLPWRSIDVDLEQQIDLEAPMGGGPIERGFGSFFGTAGCSTAQPPFAFIEGDRFVTPPTEFRHAPHFTGRPGMTAPGWDHAAVDPTFTQRAVDEIRTLSRRSEPFFLYLAASAPHEPCLEATVPEFARGMSEAGSRGDLVWLFDWMVGRVVAALQESGVAERTLVVVTSDNGALPGDRVSAEETIGGYELYNHRSCGDWRGYKAHIWEGGHRVPFVVGPAARTPAVRAGHAESTPACLTDLYETLFDVAGAPADGVNRDSINLTCHAGFSPWRRATEERPSRRRAIVHHSGAGVYSIRVGDWKLVHESTGSGGWPPPQGSGPTPGVEGQLYNLREDPAEARNLFNERTATARELIDLLRTFRAGSPTVE